ncbi:hypothetical protein J6590_102411 [Homalodisca vitripennis]|nr:hypothetical protein J6590_102411 [Homalodisca vitripennis]
MGHWPVQGFYQTEQGRQSIHCTSMSYTGYKLAQSLTQKKNSNVLDCSAIGSNTFAPDISEPDIDYTYSRIDYKIGLGPVGGARSTAESSQSASSKPHSVAVFTSARHSSVSVSAQQPIRVFHFVVSCSV